MRFLIVALLLLIAAPSVSRAQPAAALAAICGDVRTIETHNRSATRYASAPPRDARKQGAPDQDAPIALILLVGGGGNLDLDAQGCPRSLTRNTLVRMLPALQRAGFITALVDAPSDFPGDDGLAGFRITPEHADDLGKAIADLRASTKAAVWVVGHSRGTISAANAAARLAAPSAPDGVVLLSAMMVGDARARKAWVAQTVFDLPLSAIKVPLLVVGHEADNCPRSPAALMADIAARTADMRRQVVTVTGGPIAPGRAPSLAACEVGQPHDYVDQTAEVAAGIVRFVRGGRY
jgi:pimeloyl-ACP methyl ester carboxylesterase